MEKEKLAKLSNLVELFNSTEVTLRMGKYTIDYDRKLIMYSDGISNLHHALTGVELINILSALVKYGVEVNSLAEDDTAVNLILDSADEFELTNDTIIHKDSVSNTPRDLLDFLGKCCLLYASWNEDKLSDINKILHLNEMRIKEIHEHCPEGFKNINPRQSEYYPIKYFLKDNEFTTDTDTLNSYIVSYNRLKYPDNYEPPREHEILVNLIQNSYYPLYQDDPVDTMVYKVITSNPDKYDCDNYTGWKYEIISSMTKMLYRYINDGDRGENITEPCIMVGVRLLTFLQNNCTTEEMAIIKLFMDAIANDAVFSRGMPDYDNKDVLRSSLNIIGKWNTSINVESVVDRLLSGKYPEIDDVDECYLGDCGILYDCMTLIIAFHYIWKYLPDFGNRWNYRYSNTYSFED